MADKTKNVKELSKSEFNLYLVHKIKKLNDRMERLEEDVAKLIENNSK